MLYINKITALALLALLGVETNSTMTCMIADELNNSSQTETVMEKINDGCGCSFYVKKTVGKKHITDANNPEKRNPLQKTLFTIIKISYYITGHEGISFNNDFQLAQTFLIENIPQFAYKEGVKRPPRS